jgi:hypothetical protein
MKIAILSLEILNLPQAISSGWFLRDYSLSQLFSQHLLEPVEQWIHQSDSPVVSRWMSLEMAEWGEFKKIFDISLSRTDDIGFR